MNSRTPPDQLAIEVSLQQTSTPGATTNTRLQLEPIESPRFHQGVEPRVLNAEQPHHVFWEHARRERIADAKTIATLITVCVSLSERIDWLEQRHATASGVESGSGAAVDGNKS